MLAQSIHKVRTSHSPRAYKLQVHLFPEHARSSLLNSNNVLATGELGISRDARRAEGPEPSGDQLAAVGGPAVQNSLRLSI